MIENLVRRPFWLIAKYQPRRMEVLTIILACDEEALPVFSFEDEARMFLELGALGGGWRVRVTTVGELVSVLFGPCAGVERVVLDPLPSPVAEGLNDLLSMEREAFIESQLDMQRRWSFGSERSAVRSTASDKGGVCRP